MNFWLSSFTNRWHTHPMLAKTNDSVSGHQCRVALILMKLEPNISKDALVRAITHDQGEAAAGDIPYSFKRAHPDVKEKFSKFEDEVILEQGFSVPKLSFREDKLIKLSDWIDAYLWARKHEPELVDNHPDWIIQMKEMSVLSKILFVNTEFKSIIKSNDILHN